MKTKHVKVLLSMSIVLLMAWALAACSKKKDATPTVVKADLIAAISTANTLATSTHEGVAAGDYLKGSQAPFIAAIAQAQAVVDDDAATQAEVSAAIVNLASAMATYQGNLVTAIDPTNLAGQWTFDEIGAAIAGATVKDYSGNGHDGEIKVGNEFWGGGTPTLAADRYGNAGKALHFDEGANVEIPYSTGVNPGVISISLWEKQDVNNPIVNNQYMVAMNRWNGFKFNMQDSPKAFFTANPAESPGNYINEDNDAGLITQGQWWHLVVTFGDGHLRFYVNGTLTKDWTHVGTVINMSANPVNLVFGQDLPTDGYSLDDSDPNYLNWGGYYIGTLDEIRIYKSVLTQAQVTNIYNLEKP